MTHEIIDSAELAKRLGLPESWLRSAARERTPRARRIPHIKFGRYVRFEFGSPALEEWLNKHRVGGGK